MCMTVKHSSDKEKEENLMSMLKCFSKKPCYWGIDKCKLQLHSNVIMNRQHLEYLHIKNPSKIDIKYDSQCKISRIVITENTIGKITLCFFHNALYKTDCQFFELINGGINVATTGIEGLKERLKNAVIFLKDKYKISITSLDAIVKEIEVACTLALDNVPHLQTRRLLVESFANNQTVEFGTHKNSIEDYSILSSNKKKHRKTVWYDKNAKAIDKNEIDPQDKRLKDFHVHRLEIKLTHQKVKKILKNNRLNELTDEKIIEAIEYEKNEVYSNFISSIEKSVSEVETIIEKCSKVDKKVNSYYNELINHSNDRAQTLLKSLLLDEEIITLAPLIFLGKNRAKVKRKLIRNLQDNEIKTNEVHFHGRMITWETVQIFREMFFALDSAKKYGLGCIEDSKKSSVHKIHLEAYTLEFRNQVFNSTISSTRRNTLTDSDYIEKLFWNRLYLKDNHLF